MKKLIVALGVIALAASAFAQAPSYGLGTVANPISTTTGTKGFGLPPAGVSNFASTAIIDVRKMQNLGLQCTLVSSNATLSNVTFRLVYSLDASSYGSTGIDDQEFMWIVKGGKTSVTNLTVKGYGWVKFVSVSNDANANATVTNCVLKYATKISAP